jgi:creatinine amidohydrolase
MLLESSAWPDIEGYLTRDDRIVLVTGSCEQHGRHLPFPTDWVQPYEMARRAGEATGVLVAVPFTFGMSLHHMLFPGTLSLRPQTFAAVVHDLVWSSHRHGFRRVLILNGHGGNTATLNSLASDLVLELPDLELKLMDWWNHPSVEPLVVELFGMPEKHASAAETSNMLRLRPDSVHMERAVNWPPSTERALSEADWKRLYPHGNCGADPALASAEAGEKLLAQGAAAVEALLNEWEPRPGAARPK